jgi:hypothetical protein
MEVVDATQINSFGSMSPKVDFVPPSDQLITLTYGQLQDLIRVAVKEAVAPLQERLDRLEVLEEVYHGPAPQAEEMPLYKDAFERKREAMDSLPSRVWGIEQDLSALEKTSTAPKGAEPTQKTLDHLTEIAVILGAAEKRLIENQAPRAYLTRLRKEGMTFSQLARVMGLTVDRIRQLSRLAATDQRFNVTWHPRKKNTKIIKLRRWDVQEL